MNCPLAIFAPFIGGRSETFIRRHMGDLFPGKTAVVAGSSDRPHGGHWSVEGPLLILNQIPPPRLRRQVIQAIARKAGWKPKDDETKVTVKEFLQNHGVRVVMGEWLSWSLPWLEVARSLGIRFFGHGHGFDISAHLHVPKWRAEYLKYNEAAGIITVSQLSKAKLVDLGLDADKIHVVPCGVDVPSQPVIRNREEAVYCLAVARMVEGKGPILALDAFRRASKVCPQLRLDYVGEGELLPAAQHFVRAFNLEGRVTLHGGQPPEVVLGLMKKADIFLQHSITEVVSRWEEGFGLSNVEAAANGLPVVSTRSGGIPEAVLEGKTGYLVDEGDSRGMAERMVTLARDPELRRRMGEAGWRRAKEHFSWEKERDELLRVLGLR